MAPFTSQIRYWQDSVAGVNLRDVTNATATSAIINGLTGMRSYYVEVLGYTARGDGPTSSPPNYIYVSPLSKSYLRFQILYQIVSWYLTFATFTKFEAYHLHDELSTVCITITR